MPNLKKVDCEYVGDFAFSGITNYKHRKIIIGENVKYIGAYAFNSRYVELVFENEKAKQNSKNFHPYWDKVR